MTNRLNKTKTGISPFDWAALEAALARKTGTLIAGRVIDSIREATAEAAPSVLPVIAAGEILEHARADARAAMAALRAKPCSPMRRAQVTRALRVYRIAAALNYPLYARAMAACQAKLVYRPAKAA